MIEYPSIPNSSKAPRQGCVALEKMDGSNFRCKYTQKQGFHLFGTRTQLVDETSPFWAQMIEVFRRDHEAEWLKKFRSKNYRDYREIIVFGEFGGPNSFAGRHEPTDKFSITFFDVLLGHKQRKFLLPQEFVKEFSWSSIPKVVYRGNLNDEFIAQIRADKELKEGVVCKGSQRRGDAAGGVWMCKIKTQAYFDKLQSVCGAEWVKYWE